MELVQVRFIATHPRYVHEIGETPLMRPEDARFLIDNNIAVPEPTKTEKAVIPPAQKAARK